MGYFLNELKRTFTTKRFLFIIFLSLIIYFLGILNDLKFGHDTGILYFMWLTRDTFSGILAPILAALPYSGSFSLERNQNILPYILIRVPKKYYIIAKIFITPLAGGVAITLPYLIFSVILSIFFPIKPLENILCPLGHLAKTNPNLYILWLFSLTFLFGITYSLVGLAASTFFKQTFFSFIIPLILYIFPTFIFSFLNIFHLTPGTTWQPDIADGITLFTITAQQLFIIVVSIVLFIYKMIKLGDPYEKGF